MGVITYQTCPLCGSSHIHHKLNAKDYTTSGEEFEIVQCGDCEFTFTQNIPDEAGIGKYYQSENYIPHSDTQKTMVDKLYHRVREIMLGKKMGMVMQQTKGKKLLDVGCGTGYFLNFMQNNGYQTQGIEIDENSRKFAAENFGLSVLPPDHLIGGLEGKKFDVVTMWHVLEHLHDFNAYLQAIRQHMEDDGVLIIAVPNHTSHDAGHYKEHWAAYDVPRHLWHFAPNTLRRLAENNGMRLAHMNTLPFDSFYCSMLSEKYKQNSMHLISGFTVGLASYLKSVANKERCSSIAYVLKKQ